MQEEQDEAYDSIEEEEDQPKEFGSKIVTEVPSTNEVKNQDDDDEPRQYNVQQEPQLSAAPQQQPEETDEEHDQDDDDTSNADAPEEDYVQAQYSEDEADDRSTNSNDAQEDAHQLIEAQQELLNSLNSRSSGKEMPDVPLLGLDKLRKEFLSSSTAASSTKKSKSSAAKKRQLRDEVDDSSSLSSNDLRQVTLSIHESIESLKKSNDLSLYNSPKLSTWEQEDTSPPHRSTGDDDTRGASRRKGSRSPKEYNEKEHGLKLDLDLEGLDIKTSYNYNNSTAGARPRRLSYSTPFGAHRNVAAGLNTSSRKRPSSAALKSRPRFDNSPAPAKDPSKRKPSPMRQLQHSTDFETGLSVARSQVRSIKSQLVSLKSQFNEELQKNTKLEDDLKEMTTKYNKAFSNVIKYKHKVDSEQNRYEKMVAELKKEVDELKAGRDDGEPNVTQKFKQNMLKENAELRNQIKKLNFRIERLQEDKNKLQQRRRKKQTEKINDLNEIQSITAENDNKLTSESVDEAVTENTEDDVSTQPPTFLDEIQSHAESDKLKRQLREVKLKYDKDMSTIKEYLEEIRDKNMKDMQALQESKKEEILRLQKMLNQYKKQQKKDVDMVFKDRNRKLEQQKDILVQDNEQLKSQVERLDGMVHEKTQTLKRILTENLMMKSQISTLENEKGNLQKENTSFADSISNAEQMVDQLRAQFEEQQVTLEQSLKSKYEKYLDDLKEQNEKTISTLRAAHESTLNALKADHQKEMDKLRNQREAVQEELRNAHGDKKIDNLQMNQLKKENERLSSKLSEIEKENNLMRRSVQEKDLALMQQESRHAHLQTLNSQLMRHSSQLSVSQLTPSKDITSPSSGRREDGSIAPLKVAEEDSFDEDETEGSPTSSSRKPLQEAPAIPPLSLQEKEGNSSKRKKPTKEQLSTQRISLEEKSARGEGGVTSRSGRQTEAPPLPNGPIPDLDDDETHNDTTSEENAGDDFLDMKSPDKDIPTPDEDDEDDTDIHQLLNDDDFENEELDEDILKGLDDDYGDEDDFMNADLDAHINSILSAHNVK